MPEPGGGGGMPEPGGGGGMPMPGGGGGIARPPPRVLPTLKKSCSEKTFFSWSQLVWNLDGSFST